MINEAKKNVSIVNDPQTADAIRRVGFTGTVRRGGMLSNAFATQDYLVRVRTGVSRSRVDEVAALIGLTDKEMARVLTISERTLHRKPAIEPLDTNMSERLIQLELLIQHGLDVFDGRKDTFARWLRAPRPSLGEGTPLSLLDTIAGFSFVDDELSRIEEGMIS